LGTHILLSLYGVKFSLLDDVEAIKDLFNRVSEAMGATVLNRFSYKFDPQGVTVIFSLAESHVSLHSFPEEGSVAIDCYTCGEMNTKAGAQMFIDYFKPVEVSMQEIKR
jgi:S-adenosylmethionine decarboxylase